MRFALAMLSLSAAVGLSFAVPAPAGRLQKRNECTITGWFQIYQDVFDGGVGTPVTTSGFQINYVGGVLISDTNDNPLARGTFSQFDTLLAESIEWTPDFFINFSGCSASYEGTEHTGYVDNNFHPAGGWGSGPGYTHGACSVDFGCEGNLPAHY